MLRRLYDLLEDGGGFAICGTHSFRETEQPWQRVVAEAVQRWQNAAWRAMVDAQHHWGRHEEFLPASPFARWEFGEALWSRVVDVEAIIGELFSMSYCNPASLGERAPAFADELRRELLALDPSGRFEQALYADYIKVFKQRH